MKNFCMSVIVLIGSFCSGCASGLIGTLPEVKDNNIASEIYVIRPYTYVSSAISAYVSFDNNDVLAIRTVEHAKFFAQPGNHTIGVRNPGFPSNNIPLVLIPNSRYYFRVSVGFTNFSLVTMTEEEAKPYISTTKYIKLDKNEPEDKSIENEKKAD